MEVLIFFFYHTDPKHFERHWQESLWSWFKKLLLTSDRDEVRALSKALSESRGVDAGIATYEEYTVNWGSKPSDTDIKKTVVDMETDYIFLVPTQTALYLHSDHAK